MTGESAETLDMLVAAVTVGTVETVVTVQTAVTVKTVVTAETVDAVVTIRDSSDVRHVSLLGVATCQDNNKHHELQSK